MQFLKALFGSGEESPEQKQKADEARRFDMFKYDGVRAAKMGQHEYAVKCYAEALKIHDDLEVRDYLAQSLMRTDRLPEAMEQLDILAQAEPDNAAIQRQKAVVAHLMEDYTTMRQACQRALEIDADSPQAHYLSAQASMGQGEKVGAIAQLTKALALKDDYPEARLLRGQSLLSMGDAASAEEDAQWLLDNYGENEDALMLKARVERAKGNANEAIGQYGKVIDANPFNAEAYKERGALKYELGDTKGAQEDAARAMELTPDDIKGVNGDYSAQGIEHKTKQAYSMMNPLGL